MQRHNDDTLLLQTRLRVEKSMREIFGSLSGRSKTTMTMMGLVLVAVLGYLDCLTDARLSFALLYLLPLLWVAWNAGIDAGTVIAVSCSIAWLVADLKGDPSYSHTIYPYWNTGTRLVVFLTVNLLVTRLKTLNQQLQDTVLHKSAALSDELNERRNLEREVIEVSAKEQQRIGQDLHDGLCNHLASVALKCDLLEQQLEEKGVSEAASAGRIASMIKKAINQAHDHARGLNPVDVQSDSLMSALQELAGQTEESAGIQCRFRCETPVPIKDNRTATHLYRIAQEAVSNAVKHGKASEIDIDLVATDGCIRLHVRDDGKGFENGTPSKTGLGLGIMRYRSHLIGATLDLSYHNNSGSGVVVTCSLPTENRSDHI